MSEFIKKIEQLGNPAAHNRRKFSIEALITKSDERNNLCSIRFRDKDGYLSNKDNVPVRIYNTNIIDWFPVKDEWVLIEQYGEDIVIVAKHQAGYNASTRPQTQIKEDIIAGSFASTVSGYIF
jgi:hypothetical protein